MEAKERKYIKGFNQGYDLKKYHPELFGRLLGAMQNNGDYKQSLTDGGKQFEKELTQKKIQEKLKIQGQNSAQKNKR